MFTCSSCGYEANPDSAVACSLCGTKKPGAAATATASGSSAKGKAGAPAKAPEDDLAAAAQAVAESTDAGAIPASSKGKAKGSTTTTRDAHTGVIRLGKEPPPVANPATALGALVGALIGYVFAAVRSGHAPASLGELVPMVLGAILVGLALRFTLAPFLESTLSDHGREVFAGPVSMVVGLGFVAFTIVGFALGANAPTVAVEGPSQAVGKSGQDFGEHLILLTRWSGRFQNEKVFVCTLDGKELRIPSGKLSQADVDQIREVTKLPPAELDRLASDEPVSPTYPIPPADWSLETFLERLRYFYGVQKRTGGPRVPGRLALVRVKPGGGEEALYLPDVVSVAADLKPAAPATMKLWVAYGLGLKHESSPAHDAMVEQIVEKHRGE